MRSWELKQQVGFYRFSTSCLYLNAHFSGLGSKVKIGHIDKSLVDQDEQHMELFQDSQLGSPCTLWYPRMTPLLTLLTGEAWSTIRILLSRYHCPNIKTSLDSLRRNSELFAYLSRSGSPSVNPAQGPKSYSWTGLVLTNKRERAAVAQFPLS